MIHNEVAKRLLDADTKALVEAGILTPTLAVGNSTYILEFIVLNFKPELVKFAKELIKAKEEKKSNECCENKED